MTTRSRNNKNQRPPKISRARRRRLARKGAQKLRFETLEDRRMLATLTVGNATDLVNAPDLTSISALIADDGGDGISLVEAITAANNDTTEPSDTITLLTDVTLSSVNNSNILIGNNGDLVQADNGLPVITSQITIEGDGFTVGREASAPDFRILEVAGGGNLALNNLTIAEGRATRGAGLFNNGQLTLNNSVVTGNRIIGSDSLLTDGGGIANNPGGTLTVNNSQITNNYAYRLGGGIHNEGIAIVTASVVSGNLVDQNYGGGISNVSPNSSLTITSSTISGNESSYGGGVGLSGGQVVISNSTISGNRSSDSIGGGGGGIYLSAAYFNSSTLTLNNTTVTGNQSTGVGSNDGGGGILVRGGVVNLNQSLIAGNSADGPGDEIRVVGGTINADGFNLLGHSGRTNADAFAGFTPGASDLVATSDGNTPTALASILDTNLADNGGTTLTHALVAGSPAVDAAPLSVAFASGDNTDQTGANRLQGVRFDIGAVESSFSLTPEVQLNGAQGLLVDAINAANSDAAVAVFPAGSGADVITLLTDVTLSSVNNSNILIGNNGDLVQADNGLPVITSQITIEGDGFTVGREASAPDFRILEVAGGGNLALNNLTIAEGRATRGAGLFNNGQLTLNNSVVTGNRIIGSDSLLTDGGGIANNPGGTLTVNNSQITNNYAYRLGGGIHNEGIAIVTASVVSGNLVDQNYGGGISNVSPNSSLTITSSTISGNESSYGGGVGLSGGQVVISNSTISGNRSSDSIGGGGGGIYLSAAYFNSSTLTLNNTTVTGNQSTGVGSNDGGGGILVRGGVVNLNQSLIAGNSADGPGDEIRVVGGTINADGFNLLGHSGRTNADAFAGFTPGASDLVATSDGNTPTALASILDTNLADNGGTTLTHALVAGSPAVDAATTGTADDQRGVNRPQGFGFDIGAVELDTGPIVSSIERLDPTAETNNADTLVFRVTFNEAVTGVTGADDFVVSGGTAIGDLGNVTSVTAVSDTVYDLTVSSTEIADFNGTVGLDVSAATDITDLLGAALTVTEPAIDQTYTLDNEGPRPLLVSPTQPPTNLFDFPGQVIVNFTDSAGISSVELALNTPFSQFFDGTAFTAGSSQPIFLPTTDLGNGNFALPIDATAFPFAQNYFLRSRATDGLGNVLEDIVPSFFSFSTELIVDTASDESDGDFSVGDRSLREAIELANASSAQETITFDPSVFNGEAADVIRLQLGQLTISDSVAINAGDLNVVISGDTNGDDVLVPGTFVTDVVASDSTGARSDNVGRIFNVDAPGGSSVQLTGLTITGGNSAGIGGGIRSDFTNLQIDRSTIAGNTAGGSGGGIFAAATLTDSTVSGNFSNSSGGGIASASGAISLTRSTISGNSGGANGGGVFTNSGTVTIDNSTVSGNQTAGNYGGGVFGGNASNVTIDSSTVTLNSAAVSGGGVVTFGSTTFNNSIIAGNTATAGNSVDAAGTGANFTGNFNLLGASDGVTGTGNVGSVTDPLLGPLADNGGLTQTHALLPGSPALGAGDPSVVFDPVEFDQRGLGFTRVAGPTIDIGAFERQTEVPSLIVNTSSDVVDDTDFVTSLPEAILFANSNPGADTITLTTDVVLTQINNSNIVTVMSGMTAVSANGLPIVSSEITLAGGDFTVSRQSGSPDFRILEISGGGNLTLDDVTISGGETGDEVRGGGILSAGTLTLNRSIVSGNRANGEGRFYNSGGGIANLASGMLAVNDSQINQNYAYRYGGGIYNAGTAVISNSVISGNTTDQNDGGGIANRGVSSPGNLTIDGSTITGNEGRYSGGAISSTQGSVVVTNSTISSNQLRNDANNGGGGLFATGADVTLRNTTFTGNDAGNADDGGGGLLLLSSTLDLRQSIIAGNVANNNGNELLSIGSSISSDGFNLLGSSQSTTAQSLVGFTVAATDILATSDGNTPTALDGILDTTLRDNGGSTPTHSLTFGSPAIDAGNSGFLVDQRGFTRPVDLAMIANAAGGNSSDIGAVELQAEPRSFVVTTASDVVDSTDFVTSLREAIAFANTTPNVDTITFDTGVFNGELADLIRLTGGQLEVTAPIVIDGGQTGVIISGDAAGDDSFQNPDGTTRSGQGSDNTRVLDFTHSTGISTVAGVTITGGFAPASINSGPPQGVHGGGIRASADLNLVNSRITGNRANSTNGGGVFVAGTLTVADSIIENNYGFNGGGIFANSAVIERSSVRSNYGTITGGGVSSGSLLLRDSTISGNSGRDGAGVSTFNATIINSTISGNDANYYAGGISASSAIISHSTITGNSAGGQYGNDAGGIRVGSLTLSNSIVAGNSVRFGTVPDIRNSGNSTVSFSLIGDNAGSSLTEAQTPDANGNLIGGSVGGVIDPLLAPLADNGGPTLTHALLLGSPVLNAGDVSLLPADTNDLDGDGDANEAIPFDQRGTGFDRVIGGQLDIGAFEQQTEFGSLIVTTNLDVVDNTDFVTSLREAVNFANTTLGADTLTFDMSIFGTQQSIELASQLPTIVDAVTITGPGANLLTLDAGNGVDDAFGTGDGFRLFNIDDGTNTQIDVTISGLTLTGGDTSAAGGAIFNRENLTIVAGQLLNNSALTSAGGNGGGIENNFGTLDVRQSTFADNAANAGGGILNNGGVLTVSNSTFSGNTAAVGGGIASNETAVSFSIDSSTVFGNTASTGGGIFSLNPASINNTIVVGSVSGGDLAGGGALSGGFNLIQDGGNLSGLTDTVIADPQLAALADNGGPTLTHALLPGSPAIDAGDPLAVAGQNGVPNFDQRGSGFARVIGGRIDIGSVESDVVPAARIVDVIVGGSGFSAGFVDAADGGGTGAGNGLGLSLVGSDQLQTVPFAGIDTLYLQFNTDVSASLTDGDILLTGTNGGSYTLGSITYDTDTNIATIPIVGGIGIDRLVLSIFDGTVFDAAGNGLDGEFTSGQTDPSGNGTAGGRFDFFFNVLPGDEDGSEQVTAQDATNVFASNAASTDASNFRRDIDGSGQVTAADATTAFANNSNGLPPEAPTPPTPPALLTAPSTLVTAASLPALDAAFSDSVVGLLPASDVTDPPAVDRPLVAEAAVTIPAVTEISAEISSLEIIEPEVRVLPVASATTELAVTESSATSPQVEPRITPRPLLVASNAGIVLRSPSVNVAAPLQGRGLALGVGGNGNSNQGQGNARTARTTLSNGPVDRGRSLSNRGQGESGFSVSAIDDVFTDFDFFGSDVFDRFDDDAFDVFDNDKTLQPLGRRLLRN